MSQVPPSNVTPPDAATAEDHLSRLHKMSTTAGVTNLDYVAVNQAAIVAVLLGLGSALAFFGYLLLVIPVVGVVFAVVAIRQVNDSNGTQTGRGLAWAGLALCVLLGGTAIGLEVVGAARVKGDESRIAAAIRQLGEQVKAGKVREAYDQFDPEFRGHVPFEQFQQVWNSLLHDSPLGRLDVVEWNGVTPVFESAGGKKLATTKMRMKFDKGPDERFDVVLREADGTWRIVRMTELFPEAKPATGGKPEDAFNL